MRTWALTEICPRGWIVIILSLKCCAKVAGFFTAKKKDLNHGDAENTEAKQKEEKNMEKEFRAKTRRRKGKEKIAQIL